MLFQKQINSAWEAIIEDGERAHFKGDYREAEFFYEAALVIAGQGKVTDRSSAAKVLLLLADLYAEQHKYGLSEDFLREALAVFENIQGTDHIDMAITLRRLSEICHIQSKDLEAFEYKQKADQALSSTLEHIKNSFTKRVASRVDQTLAWTGRRPS